MEAKSVAVVTGASSGIGRATAVRLARDFSAVVLVAVVAGVVPFALHAWAALHGNFDQDDFVVTYQAAAAGPFDLGFLFQDYHGHLAPGGFFLAALIVGALALASVAMVAIIPLVNARIMHRLIPHSQLHVYHGGHLELAADSGRLAAAVQAFLDADLTPEGTQP